MVVQPKPSVMVPRLLTLNNLIISTQVQVMIPLLSLVISMTEFTQGKEMTVSMQAWDKILFMVNQVAIY
jgi:hypothetical protein